MFDEQRLVEQLEYLHLGVSAQRMLERLQAVPSADAQQLQLHMRLPAAVDEQQHARDDFNLLQVGIGKRKQGLKVHQAVQPIHPALRREREDSVVEIVQLDESGKPQRLRLEQGRAERRLAATDGLQRRAADAQRAETVCCMHRDGDKGAPILVHRANDLVAADIQLGHHSVRVAAKCEAHARMCKAQHESTTAEDLHDA